MLDLCLNYLKERMNQSIRNTFDLPTDIVIVAPPADLDGSKPDKIQNKILLFISNIEKDSFSKTLNQNHYNSKSTVTTKPLFITLTITIAANFSNENYSDGLKVLSHLLAFFNRNNSFNHTNSPELPNYIEKINMDLESIPGDQLNHMWGIFGSHYLPSCIYRVRALVPNSESILNQVGSINISESDISKRDA